MSAIKNMLDEINNIDWRNLSSGIVITSVIDIIYAYLGDVPLVDARKTTKRSLTWDNCNYSIILNGETMCRDTHHVCLPNERAADCPIKTLNEEE